MFKAIRFARTYGHLLPILIDFIDTVLSSTEDKQLSKKERSQLMKQYWSLVRAIRETKYT
jgi:hypothetical protein